MEKCENGIDTSDLYYDFDLPGDAYPFGDAEGMDWVPDDWKPPEGDEYPHQMLGPINYRINYTLTIEAQEQGVDVNVLIPFVTRMGTRAIQYDSNQKVRRDQETIGDMDLLGSWSALLSSSR